MARPFILLVVVLVPPVLGLLEARQKKVWEQVAERGRAALDGAVGGLHPARGVGRRVLLRQAVVVVSEPPTKMLLLNSRGPSWARAV